MSSVTESSKEMASFDLQMHNPDVLTCIANLSNDEVFTPPELANQMLDTVAAAWAESNDGANIWADLNVTFLDPFTKSGVFLREIVRRLVDGLAGQIPDQQQRVDHVLSKQVFGIGITQLTSLLARRSVYCSKQANGKQSIATVFDSEDGNIWFERTEHTWEKRKKVQRVHPTSGITEVVEDLGSGRCKFCGAAESEYLRGADLETHAYAFIHTDNIKARIAELFGADMQFDVIIGNPPYQLDTGGAGRQAKPIYNLFVDQAKKLEPRHLLMVIQSRWFGGGMGLGEFRATMLNDRRIRTLVDYTNSNDVFPGTDFGGGICYFDWSRDEPGDCEIVSYFAGKTFHSVRALNEFPHFIRYSPSLPILRKVLEHGGEGLRPSVSSVRPFGVPSTYRPTETGDYRIVSSKGAGRVAKEEVTAGAKYIDSWNVLLSKTSHDHAGLPDKHGMRRVLSRMELLEPGAVCSESYIVVGSFDTKDEAKNCHQYLTTKFARFLMSLLSYSHNITGVVFEYVPAQEFSRPWSDAELYEKYGITDEEIAFIESMIRPMELGTADEDA